MLRILKHFKRKYFIPTKEIKLLTIKLNVFGILETLGRVKLNNAQTVAILTNGSWLF